MDIKIHLFKIVKFNFYLKNKLKITKNFIKIKVMNPHDVKSE